MTRAGSALRAAALVAAAAAAAAVAACGRAPDEAWLRIVSFAGEGGEPVTSLVVDLDEEATAEVLSVQLENRSATVGVSDGGTGIAVTAVRVEGAAGGRGLPAQEHPATVYLAPGAESATAVSVTAFPPALKHWVRDNLTVPEGGLAGSLRLTLSAVTDEGRRLEVSGGLGLLLVSGAGSPAPPAPGLPTASVRTSLGTASDTAPVSNGAFVFELDRAATGTLSVGFSVSGSATEGVDYADLGGAATFTAGRSSATVEVVPIADGDAEGSETVEVRISPGTGYGVGSPASAIVNIND